MDSDTVFVKTRTGIDEQFDPRTRLSAAFRRLLTVIDGKRSLRELQEELPHLSGGDIGMWASELAKLRYIEPVAQFETSPESTYEYQGYVEMTKIGRAHV